MENTITSVEFTLLMNMIEAFYWYCPYDWYVSHEYIDYENKNYIRILTKSISYPRDVYRYKHVYIKGGKITCDTESDFAKKLQELLDNRRVNMAKIKDELIAWRAKNDSLVH